MLVSFFLSTVALAGLTSYSEIYPEEASVALAEKEEFPTSMLFASWVQENQEIQGSQDGTFFAMTAGWAAYGYQQTLQPRSEGQIGSWGWESIQEEDPGQELEMAQMALICQPGQTTSEEWTGSGFPISLMVEELQTGEAWSLTLSRVRIRDGLLSVDCSDLDLRGELVLILSWMEPL